MKVSDLRNLSNSKRIVILDGAMGTELERRGVKSRLPLWSSWALLEAPEVVRAIHREYIEAGADIVTANTFRTHRRSLAREGIGDRAKDLTRLAVDLAVSAREDAGGEILIAGSLAPLEDCYHPERVPPRHRLAAEHAEMAENLARAGVDLLLVETMGTIEEIDAASRAAEGTGLPYLLSAIPREDGALLGGQSLAEMARLLESRGPLAVLVNCADYRAITKAIQELLTAQGPFPLGAYANMGGPEYEKGWSLTDQLSPGQYAEVARTWVDMGVRVVGGCCGTTPAHITELASALN